MNLSTASVAYQVFDPLAPVRHRTPPRSAEGAAAPPRSRRIDPLDDLPAAGRPLFIGDFDADALDAWRLRHGCEQSTSLAWGAAAMPQAEAGCDLVVVDRMPDDAAALAQLQRIAGASSPGTPLRVRDIGSGSSIERTIEDLMNAGWMPELRGFGSGAARGSRPSIDAVNVFAALPAGDAAGPASFEVIVVDAAAQPDGRCGAIDSPGLHEVDAQVRIAAGPSAGEAIEAALRRASAAPQTDWVLICRPEAYFPAGFGRRLDALLATIAGQDRRGTLLGFLGIGVDADQQGFAPAGFVVEGGHRESYPESAAAVSIDELALVVARDSLHRIDPAMGWRFWATELCLAAICRHRVFPRIARLPILNRQTARPDDASGKQASAALLLANYPDFGPIPTLDGMIDARFVADHHSRTDAATATAPAPAAAPVIAAPGPLAGAVPCVICGQPVERWTPHPRIGQRSEWMKLLGAVGSDLSVYQCPHCGSNDRDRHLWHYMRAVGLTDLLPGMQLLHIAPERPIEVLIEAARPRAYVRGDLQPRRPGHLKLDIESLPFDDGSFDLVICNHVLEHVADPARALAELHRCLVPGGVLIAQTPYAPTLKHTLEMTTPVSPAFARLVYGQDDHLRLFGAEIVQLFRAAGFGGEPSSHDSVLPGMDARVHGCNGAEPFFAFTR